MVSPVIPPSRFDRGTGRILVCGLSTVSAVVLLFSYRTSTAPELAEAAGARDTADDASVAAVPRPDAAPADRSAATRAPVPAAPAGRTRRAGAGWSGTVTGPVVQVTWGQVQVRATLAAGRITGVDVLRAPDENAHDRQVNAAAVPVLVRETLAAQSTRIDMVSGATFTSTGYVRSLQAALDRAGTT
jgi:uncharacterized protein with FMN-binding domain